MLEILDITASKQIDNALIIHLVFVLCDLEIIEYEIMFSDN